jgi:glutaredoxin
MALAKFWRWLTQSPRRPRSDLHVVVYTRDACPLCDEALAILRRFQAQYGFAMTLTNVDASEALACEYGNCVPMVAINGKVRFRGHVNEVMLRRLLDAP